MPSLVSHKWSIIKYVVLKKIIFFFLCFDRLIWTWTWLGLEPLWTRSWLGLEPLWTRSWLGLEPLWTWTCLGLDKGGLDYSPNLERLARCPEVEDQQGTAALAALETPEGVASLPAPLHFWAEETERSARWRPLRPGTLAGLADWSPEGTEERRASCNAVYSALPQRGLPS